MNIKTRNNFVMLAMCVFVLPLASSCSGSSWLERSSVSVVFEGSWSAVAEAQDLARRADYKNDAEAQYELAERLWLGIGGVRENEAAALDYYRFAAAQCHLEAIDELTSKTDGFEGSQWKLKGILCGSREKLDRDDREVLRNAAGRNDETAWEILGDLKRRSEQGQVPAREAIRALTPDLTLLARRGNLRAAEFLSTQSEPAAVGDPLEGFARQLYDELRRRSDTEGSGAVRIAVGRIDASRLDSDGDRPWGEMLQNSCARTWPASFHFYARAKIEDLMKELRLQVSGFLDERTTEKLGRLHGIQLIILGTIYWDGPRSVIEAGVYDVGTGRLLASKRGRMGIL